MHCAVSDDETVFEEWNGSKAGVAERGRNCAERQRKTTSDPQPKAQANDISAQQMLPAVVDHLAGENVAPRHPSALQRVQTCRLSLHITRRQRELRGGNFGLAHR